MKYNGINPVTIARGISIAKEIPPGSPNSQLETASGSEGDILLGRTIHEAEYVVRINVAAKTRREAWEIREKLAAWACAADTVTHPLEPTHWPGKAYDAVLKYISEPEFIFGFGTMDLVFSLPRPIAYALEESATAKSELEEGQGVLMTVKVEGSSYIRPRITINAKEASHLTIAADEETWFKMDHTFTPGDTVTIETNPPSVIIHPAEGDAYHAEHMLDYTATDLDMLCKRLTPGLHTISSQAASRILMEWRSEYL